MVGTLTNNLLLLLLGSPAIPITISSLNLIILKPVLLMVIHHMGLVKISRRLNLNRALNLPMVHMGLAKISLLSLSLSRALNLLMDSRHTLLMDIQVPYHTSAS